MANVLTLGGTSSTIDLTDETAFEAWTFQGPPNPTRERNIQGISCGGAPGATAVLQKSRILYWTRTYTVYCTGSDIGDAEQKALLLDVEVTAARKYNIDRTDPAGHAVYLVRHLIDYGQARPNVWTILDGLVVPLKEEYYGIRARPKWLVKLELDCMVGAPNVDAFGYPV